MKTSRSRSVVGVTFEGIRSACMVIRVVHSEGVRRLEIRWIERCGVSARGRVWSVGFGVVVILLLSEFL